jgi:NADPH:quinone reductase-like Zn-dependent oxidoreductase
MKNATMRAAAIERFGGPLQICELPIPLPGPGQVRIRIAAAAVNRADLGMVEGRYHWREPVRFPLVPGWELAGRVDAVGEGVTTFHMGDQVIALTVHPLTQAGSYAEYVVLPEKYLVPVPSETEMTEASGLPLAGLSALQAVEKLALVPSQTLLINGPLGSVGGFAAQLAAQRGITVLAVVHARDAELARALGAKIILDRALDLVTQVRQALGNGVDAALDVVGAAAATKAFAAVREGGRYVTVIPEWWIPGGPATPERGITPQFSFINPDAGQLARLVRLLATGQLKVRVAEVLRLEQASTAQQLLKTGGLRGKVILMP